MARKTQFVDLSPIKRILKENQVPIAAVAMKAGMFPSQLSVYLQGPRNVTEETRDRILEACSHFLQRDPDFGQLEEDIFLDKLPAPSPQPYKPTRPRQETYFLGPLASFLRDHGITKKQLADKSGLSPQRISHYTRGPVRLTHKTFNSILNAAEELLPDRLHSKLEEIEKRLKVDFE